MPIQVECPRCKQSQSVASKMAGTYVTCAYCNCRLLVPKKPSAPPVPEMAVPPPRPAQGVPSPPPPTVAPAAIPAPPVAPAPERKVARFITAEAARSTLTVNADGKLPDLHLSESDAPGTKEEKSSGVNPVLLLGVICLSIVTSVMLVLIDTSSTQSPPSEAKWRARRVIEEEFFSSLDRTDSQRYQVLLRDAQRAYARGDRSTERKLYRKVLDLLHAERGPYDSLTGSPGRDRQLEEQINILLREE